MKKIRISANWAEPDKIKNRLIGQFLTEEFNLNNIEFVNDDSYDIRVFYNYVQGDVKPDTKIYIFPVEPYWSGAHQCNIDKRTTVFGFDRLKYSNPDQVIESIAHPFYGGRGDWVDPFEDWTYKAVKKYDNIIKTKNISSIVTTKKNATVNSCLYPQRYNLINSILHTTDYVDFFGGWHGYPNCNLAPQQLTAVHDYKFCLAIENEYTKNWITEKFYDPILTNTIPIYYGCPNIKKYYPENGYIMLESITDIEYVKNKLKYIAENANTLYSTMLPEAKKIKHKYFSQFNPLKKIISLDC